MTATVETSEAGLRPAAAPSAAPDATAILVRGLRVILGDQPALRGVNLTVVRGIRLALVGPNGAGKSTLLRVLAGLLRPESGEVTVCGHTLTADPWGLRRAVGLVGHHTMLHPDLTAHENLAIYAQLYGLDRVAARVDDGLRAVALSDRAASRVATLSRGMLQRLTLARALLHDPAVLLLDEAETGLDARARDLLADTLGNSQQQRTVVLASHDLAYVHEVADEIAFMRSGRVVERVRTADVDAATLRQRYADTLTQQPATARPAATPTAAGG
jgi:heme exporter protein A